MTVFIDPFMADILDRLRALPAVDLRNLPIAEARMMSEAASRPWNANPTRLVDVSDSTIPGPEGALRIRLYRPTDDARASVIVYVHGGGWTFGSLDSHDGQMRRLAACSGCVVLGVDYRLSPEHPFPAPLHDVAAALRFVEEGGLGAPVESTRIALAGDSAGANLALGALLALRDRGAPPLATAALFYGCYAPDFETESHRAFGDGTYLLSTVMMRWYWGNFLGETEPNNPIAAPLAADLTGLPPLYLNVGGLDPLRDDTLLLSRALAAAGVRHRLDVFPGVVHGFMRMSDELPAARDSFTAAGQFLRDLLN